MNNQQAANPRQSILGIERRTAISQSSSATIRAELFQIRLGRTSIRCRS
jgi:hypothetical protein